MGVASCPTPINDVRLPGDFRRGVGIMGNGTKVLTVGVGVRIMVEGAWVEILAEGGNTNNVWEGVGRG